MNNSSYEIILTGFIIAEYIYTSGAVVQLENRRQREEVQGTRRCLLRLELTLYLPSFE